MLERASILSSGDTIDEQALGLNVTTKAELPELKADALETLETLESKIIQARLAHFEGNAVKAAKSLGLSRSAFYRRLEKIEQ